MGTSPTVIRSRVSAPADSFVKAEHIAAFKAEMDAAGANYSFINLPGAKHSCTNPDADEHAQRFNIPLAYSPEADKRSWEEMQQVLREIYSR